MADTTIYQDVKERTGGDIYIGVVGPTRCGKSSKTKRWFYKIKCDKRFVFLSYK